MPSKKHVLIVVPDGVGIKNYLYSRIPKILSQSAKITIWSTLPQEAFNEIKALHNIEFGYKQIFLKPESWLVRLLREATTYARLRYYRKLKHNPTIMMYWRPQRYSLKVRLLYSLAEYFGLFIGRSYNSILNAENFGFTRISGDLISKIKSELKDIKPDSVLITHQRVPGLMPFCIAAKELNIKTVSAIYSWDNLPKARLAIRADFYLVWSKWMKAEMHSFYPEIPVEQIIVTGTPQFEFYSEKERLITREKFAKTYNLNVEKKWICFSGDDEITSPYDPLFLRDIAKELKPYGNNVQVIFRRCPADFSDRYDNVLEEYSGLISILDPIWHVNSKLSWNSFFPKINDVDLQVNLAHHCDMVINLGSTMALDFATFNKPCLYLNYNPSEDMSWSADKIYKFQHFTSMEGLDGVGWINSAEEILHKVRLTLTSPNEMGKDRQAWMRLLVLAPYDKNSMNIVKEIL